MDKMYNSLGGCGYGCCGGPEESYSAMPPAGLMNESYSASSYSSSPAEEIGDSSMGIMDSYSSNERDELAEISSDNASNIKVNKEGEGETIFSAQNNPLISNSNNDSKNPESNTADNNQSSHEAWQDSKPIDEIIFELEQGKNQNTN